VKKIGRTVTKESNIIFPDPLKFMCTIPIVQLFLEALVLPRMSVLKLNLRYRYKILSKGPGSIFQSANVNRYDHSDDTERNVPSVVVVPAHQSLKI